MPETVRERWRTANRFADVLEAEVKMRRNPLAARVVSWFNLCRVCQDLEEQMLLAPQPGEDDSQLHRALLSTAKVESLRVTFTQWHTELKPERQAAILKEAFRGTV